MKKGERFMEQLERSRAKREQVKNAPCTADTNSMCPCRKCQRTRYDNSFIGKHIFNTHSYAM